MKVFKLESLRTKILLAVFAVLLPAFILTLYVFTYEASQMQEAAALQYAEALAQENAAHVQASLEVALQTARTLAASLKGMKTHGHASRAEANAILQSAAEANPRLLGTWTIWEPNAFDGRDRQSIGQPGTDPNGRFAPYWNRGHGQVRVEPIHDFETPGLGNFYLIPKRTGRETIVEPYSYNISGNVILMTSLVVPIIVQDHFAGVAGVDIPLAAFQDMVSHIRPYGTGYARLLSNGGRYIATPNARQIGHAVAATAAARPELAAIRAGRIFQDYEQRPQLGKVFNIYEPVRIGQTGTPWSFAITVPMRQVLVDVRRIRDIALTIGIVSLAVLIILLVLVVQNTVIRPLTMAMGIARRLSEGFLDTPVRIRSHDEMGQLLGAMRTMAEKLLHMKRIETELTVTRTQTAIARQIQQVLFPANPPPVEGLLLAGRCVPAAQVGGDYYDYFQRDRDAVDIAISDVAGHGLGAALLMTEARSILRANVYSSTTAAEVIAKLNTALYDDLNRAELFVTVFIAKYTGHDRLLTYASAGHNPPLLLRRQAQACELLDAEGMILGVIPEIRFEEKSVRLEQGDLVLFYTDGATDVTRPDGERFGIDRLCAFLARARHTVPEALIDALLLELKQFCQCETFSDDVTVVALKIR